MSLISLCPVSQTTGTLFSNRLRWIRTMFHAESHHKPSIAGHNFRTVVSTCLATPYAFPALSFAPCVAYLFLLYVAKKEEQSRLLFPAFPYSVFPVLFSTGKDTVANRGLSIRNSRNFYPYFTQFLSVFCVSTQRFLCVNTQKIA